MLNNELKWNCCLWRAFHDFVWFWRQSASLNMRDVICNDLVSAPLAERWRKFRDQQRLFLYSPDCKYKLSKSSYLGARNSHRTGSSELLSDLWHTLAECCTDGKGLHVSGHTQGYLMFSFQACKWNGTGKGHFIQTPQEYLKSPCP